MTISVKFRTIIKEILFLLQSMLFACFFTFFHRHHPNNDDCLVTKRIQHDRAIICKSRRDKVALPREASYTSFNKRFYDGSISIDLEHQGELLDSCPLESPKELQKQQEKKFQLDEQCDLRCYTTNELPICSRVDDNEAISSDNSRGKQNFSHFEGIQQKTGTMLKPTYADITPPYAKRKDPNLNYNNSPFPTPFSIKKEMQTPGTAYPFNLEDLRIRKHPRIHLQYVYPALKPVENFTPSRCPAQLIPIA